MKKNTLVLFIHGFCNNSQAWDKMKMLLSNDLSLENIELSAFEYSTGLFKLKPAKEIYRKNSFAGFFQIFCKDCFSISELAELLDEKIKSEYYNYNDIILVCHSMGGLIARKYLLSCDNSNVTKLIMFGTPVKGAKAAKYLNYFLKDNDQLSDLKKNSKFLIELNNSRK